MHLSIVIPAYNEKDNIEKQVLNQVHLYLKKQPYQYQVIIVDDGSTDGSPELLGKFVANKKHWQLIRNPHQGKAQTVATGVSQAQGNLVLFTDFDQATPISEIEKLLPFIGRGYDVIIGSREVKGSKREKEPWYRHLMGRGFNLFVKLFTIKGIRDTQCGFKLFKTEVAQELFAALVVYGPRAETTAFTGAFDVELLYLAQKRGYRIAEVPIHWQHIPTTRVNPIKDSIRMFLDLVRIRLTDLLGKYSSPPS
jgi:dolichyl-phosphate beta-glucosyltransferase